MADADKAPEAAAPAGSLRLLGGLLFGSAPMMLVQTSTYLVILLTTQRLGHHSPEWLAGASLGGLVYNVFGLMLAMAPLVALDTVAPQAWGAGRRAEVGLHCQRAVVTALLFVMPASLLWGYAEPILVALGQPHGAARLAAEYLRVLLPALPLQVVFESARRFLYAQSVRYPPLVAALLGVVLHPLWVELLMPRFGFAGGPMSVVCTQVVFLAALLLLLAWKKPHDPSSWPGISPRRLLRDRRAACRFLGISVAGLFSLSEWLFWEAVCFRAGRFGKVPLATHGIAYSLLPLAFMIPFGVSLGMSNGVGQRLGAGDVAEAKRLAAVALALGFVLTFACSAASYAARDPIIRLYTQDAEVIAAAEAVWPWLCLDLLFDGSFALLSGLCRGLGLQKRAAILIAVSLWPVGLPLIYLGSHSVLDIWRLMPMLYVTMDVGLAFSFSCANWAKLAEAIEQEGSLATSSSTGASSSSTEIPAI